MNPLSLLPRTLWGPDPLQLILYVTARCNLRCNVCFYWENIEDASNKEELTLAEISRMSSTMCPFPWLLIGGGEPMLRGDLAEVIKTFIDGNGVTHVSVPTNGFYTDKISDFVERLLRSDKNTRLNIGLSVHDIGERHDEIVGLGGAFDQLQKSHAKLRELQRFYSNLGVGTIVAISRTNQKRWHEILSFAIEDMGFDSIALAKARGQPKQPELTDVDADLYSAAAKYVDDAVMSGKLPGFSGIGGSIALAKDRLAHKDIEAMMRGSGYLRPCHAGRLSAVVDETGIVFPCELLDRPLGNLRDVDMNFPSIWHNQTSDETRTWIRDTQCHCTHECFLAMNLLAQPKTAAKIAAGAVLRGVGNRS